MREPNLFFSIVDNEPLRAPGRQFLNRNPADPTDVIGPFVAISDEGYEAAVRSAQEAATSWGALTLAARGRVLEGGAALLRERVEEVALTLTREEGKTNKEALGEVLGAARMFELMAVGHPWASGGRVGEGDAPQKIVFTQRYPRGVVAAITPWNFPIANPAVKISAALITGNTIIWKPSPWTPLTSLALAQCLRDAGLPPGVLNTILDDTPHIGQVMCADNRIGAITFTGSTQVGRLVAQAAGLRSAPVQLEMGGKNCIVVLADANLPAAARQTALSAFSSTGQKCTAASRVIVLPQVRDEFLSLLLQETRKLRVGMPTDPSTDIGPVAHHQLLEAHLETIERASSRIGKPLCGGKRLTGELESGYFLEPTIFDAVPRSDPLARDEIFGPILSVIDARDFGDAIEIVNESSYGFVASVFTRNLPDALTFAERIDAGVVKINEPTTGSSPNFPIGGWKSSGLGEPELGPNSTRFFTQEKSIYVNYGQI